MQARNLNELFAVLRRTWSYGYGFQAIRHAKERLVSASTGTFAMALSYFRHKQRTRRLAVERYRLLGIARISNLPALCKLRLYRLGKLRQNRFPTQLERLGAEVHDDGFLARRCRCPRRGSRSCDGFDRGIRRPIGLAFSFFESGQVGRWRCRRTARGCSRSTRPTTGSRSSPSPQRAARRTPASVPVGLEPVAVAARTDSEVWVVNHLSDSVSIVDVDARRVRARRAHAARRRRAARHRLRRRRPDARLHHHRAPRPEQPDDPAAHHAGRRPRRRLGLRRRPTSGDVARRHAAHDPHPVRRHAARARRLARRRAGLRRGLPLRQPHHDRASSGWSRRASGGCRAAHDQRRRASTQPETGLIVQVRRRALGRRARPHLGRRRSSFSLPDHDVFAIDAMRQPAARSPVPRRATPASARSSSTWRSTR